MISVLLATTGRPDRAEACVQGLRETTRHHRVEVVVAVDADPETAQRLSGVDTLIYSPTYRGCSRAWNDCLAEATGDPVVLAADDLVWGEGWLDAALRCLDENPGCLVGFNDGHWNQELSTHYLLPRAFIIEVLGGVIAWEHYQHSFNDVEANERAKRAGRYVWCEDAHVHHEHWLFGDRAQDGTDTRVLGEHAESQAIYRERAAAGFPDDHEAVIS